MVFSSQGIDAKQLGADGKKRYLLSNGVDLSELARRHGSGEGMVGSIARGGHVCSTQGGGLLRAPTEGNL